MISIKKFLETEETNTSPAEGRVRAPEARVQEVCSPLAAYQSALRSMGIHGHRAVASLGPAIEAALSEISQNLTQNHSPEALAESRRMVEEQLTQWADKAERNQKEREQTVRDLLQVVFEAGESTGNRDEKFSREISELSERLRVVAGLESVPMIRRSIMENATALNHTVARMATEGRESIRKLTSEIAEYQTRLVASERRASLDPLTGLYNRRGFEQQLELRIQKREPFSLLLADLNDFKTANDRYGHLVGDEILRQFADEFRQQFVAEDTVTRWGGDEFAAIVAGPPKEGELRADRVRQWVLGDYNINVEAKTITLKVDAALGTVSWNGEETGQELFARADREMYRVKQARCSGQPRPPAGVGHPHTAVAAGRPLASVSAGLASIKSDAKSPAATARPDGRSLIAGSSGESSAPWKRP